jgi:hypothetical protein
MIAVITRQRPPIRIRLKISTFHRESVPRYREKVRSPEPGPGDIGVRERLYEIISCVTGKYARLYGSQKKGEEGGGDGGGGWTVARERRMCAWKRKTKRKRQRGEGRERERERNGRKKERR